VILPWPTQIDREHPGTRHSQLRLERYGSRGIKRSKRVLHLNFHPALPPKTRFSTYAATSSLRKGQSSGCFTRIVCLRWRRPHLNLALCSSSRSGPERTTRTFFVLTRIQTNQGNIEDEERLRKIDPRWVKTFHALDGINDNNTNGFFDIQGGVTLADKVKARLP